MAKRKVKSPPKKRTVKKSKFPLMAVFISVLLFILAGIAFQFYSKDQKSIKRRILIESIPAGFPSFGIDVSHHQGEIPWEELFKDQHYDSIIQFVYCKATEGTDHLDTRWKENRNALNRLNVPNGPYHFFSGKTEALPQAQHFLNNWTAREGDLPPVLDVESEGFSDEQLIKGMKIWLLEVEKQTGMRPVIYTSLHFFETKFMNEFKEYKFWIAAYSRKPDCIEDSRIIHWQYSESGELPGISEKVDFNVSKISYR